MPEDLLPCPAPEGDPAYRVEFRDVTFSYNDGRRPALAHVSFRLKKGQSLEWIATEDGWYKAAVWVSGDFARTEA